jgi:ribosomal protein S18 acetylase RimI-like enzyme
VGIDLRPFAAHDRDAAEATLIACGAFTDEEVSVALEVIDVGVQQGIDGDYPLFVAVEEGRVRGYICVGKTPLTRGTWHLYWICVHPAAQAHGVGRALQQHAESFVRSRGGERLVLETSTTPVYERARRFYSQMGYVVVGRIADFYKPGDDCAIYCKVIAPERIA